MTFLRTFTMEIIATGILLIVIIFLRIISAKLIRRYAKVTYIMENRTNMVVKYVHLFINIIALFAVIIIWGVQKKDILITLSSITTVVGVALFAQWSILSNITSGIILFFFFPFRIGDSIYIHDKDFTIQAEIEDIKAFYVYLKTESGEQITYPNNLLLQKGISILKPKHENKEFTD